MYPGHVFARPLPRSSRTGPNVMSRSNVRCEVTFGTQDEAQRIGPCVARVSGGMLLFKGGRYGKDEREIWIGNFLEEARRPLFL